MANLITRAILKLKPLRLWYFQQQCHTVTSEHPMSQNSIRTVFVTIIRTRNRQRRLLESQRIPV